MNSVILKIIQSFENLDINENEWKEQIQTHFDILKNTQYDIINDTFLNPETKKETNLLGIITHKTFQKIADEKYNKKHEKQILNRTSDVIGNIIKKYI